MDLKAKFEAGFEYDAFLAKYGNEEHRGRWAKLHAAVTLKPTQVDLLRSFTREMKVFCLAGAWCGDCVNQCPIFDHFARATPTIRLRFFDRDANPDLAERLSICGAARVPAVWFVSEDDFPCGMYGDRTLSKYREMAAALTGAACPTGIVLPGLSQLEAVVQDWLDEFERIQCMLRTSARLRKLHGEQ